MPVFKEDKSIRTVEEKGNVVIDNHLDQYQDIRYENCEFDEMLFYGSRETNRVNIKRCKIKRLKIEFASLKSLILNECQIDEFVIEDDIEKFEEFHEWPTDWKKGFKFSILRLGVTSLTKIGMLKMDRASISYINVTSAELKQVECNACLFDHAEFRGIYDCDSFFLNMVRIVGSIDLDRLTTSKLRYFDCSIERLQLFESNIKHVDIGLRNGKDVNLHNNHIDELDIEGHAFEDLSITVGRYGRITFRASQIQSLFIGSGYRTMSKSMLEIGQLDFSHYAKMHTSKIKINDLRVREFLLQDFDNLGTLEVSDAVVSYIDVHTTMLKEAQFNSISISNMFLYNSVISDAKFNNIIWPKKHMLNEPNELKEKKETQELGRDAYFIKLAEAYRQLKVVSANASDKYNALAFQHHEMTNIWNATNLSPRNNLGNWLILGSNKLFSDFGHSLKKPLLWLFGTHLILFMILLCSFDLPVGIDIHNHSWPAFWKGLGMYLNLLSPVHGGEIEGTSIYGVTDFVMRLFAGYFIYYFIRATRKFNLSI